MKMDKNKIELTIGIPAAGRTEKLVSCVRSIQNYAPTNVKIIILNNAITDIPDSIKLLDNVQIIKPQICQSPSASRKLIGDNTETPYLLYLDEDMTISPNSVERLIDFMNNNKDISIASGVLFENKKEFPIAYHFGFGKIREKMCVWKEPIYRCILISSGLDYYQTDFAHPPFVLRTSILKNVSFDPNFYWGSELFDFFLQCYNQRIKSASLEGVIFYHHPGVYQNETFKTKHFENNRLGKQYFNKKWGIEIIPAISYKFSDILLMRIKNRFDNLIKKVKFLKL